MEFVKLKTTYYNDLAIMAAGEAAEVLFTRALAFAGEQETDGFIPAAVVPRLAPNKTSTRISSLVREGLWVKVTGGWQIAGWEKHQALKSELDMKRDQTRQRVAAHRDRKRSNSVTATVTNAAVTPPEVEIEVDAAAAATREHAAAAPLPGSLEVLKAKLDARKLTVRWDKLKPDQLAAIEALVDQHGDGILVRAALQAYRPDNPPAFAQAWLETWRAIPVGRLAAVAAPACELSGHTGTTTHCVQCASEQKAAR